MRKLLALPILLLFACQLAHAQGGQRINTALVTAGNNNAFAEIVPFATISVCPYSVNLVCNSPSVSIYKDVGLTQPQSNPFSADAAGVYYYYSTAGLTVLEKVCTTYMSCKTYVVTLPGGSNTPSQTVTVLLGSANLLVPITADGATSTLTPNLSLFGSIQGDSVQIGTTPALPNGVEAFGFVTSPGVVTVQVLNLSGSPTSATTYLFNAFVLHSIGSGPNASEISVTSAVVPGTVADGDVLTAGTTLSLPGAFIGDPVIISASPALPNGVEAFGKVTSNGVVTLDFVNLSTTSQTLSSANFKAEAVHTSGGVTPIILATSQFVSVGVVGDGNVVQPATATIAGAVVGDTVTVSAFPTLPSGVNVFGYVSGPNVVQLNVLNLSGSTANLGSYQFNVSVVH